MGCEQLLKREGTFVNTKEGTRIPSLNTGDLVCTRGYRRKMCLTRQMRQVDTWAAAHHLVSPFSSPFLGSGDRHWTLYFILFIKIFEIFKSSFF